MPVFPPIAGCVLEHRALRAIGVVETLQFILGKSVDVTGELDESALSFRHLIVGRSIWRGMMGLRLMGYMSMEGSIRARTVLALRTICAIA